MKTILNHLQKYERHSHKYMNFLVCHFPQLKNKDDMCQTYFTKLL